MELIAFFALIALLALALGLTAHAEKVERKRSARLIRTEAEQIRNFLLCRFDEFDTNGDGKLSDEELEEALMRLFDRERLWVEAVCRQLKLLGHRAGERTLVVADAIGGAHAVVIPSYAISREDLLRLEERIEAAYPS